MQLVHIDYFGMCSLYKFCHAYCREYNGISFPVPLSTWACSLFVQDFEKCKARLIERGESFRETAILSRSKIGACAEPFIRDGAVRLDPIPKQLLCQQLTLLYGAGDFDVWLFASGISSTSTSTKSRQAFPCGRIRITT